MHLLYEGQSLLTGEPVIALVSGIDRTSSNHKTGPMAQIWYLARDRQPLEAIRTGADSAVCGDCKMRGDGAGKGRSCYVTLMHGPRAMYQQWAEGAAKTITKPSVFWGGRAVRFGAYGDPASVPTDITANVAKHAANWTGYTHAWRTCDPELKRWLMASVDSPEEYYEAKSMGWKTFRVRRRDEPRIRGEKPCPASEEAGKLLTCFGCRRCSGTEGGTDSTIIVHGNGRKHFNLMKVEA